MSEANQQENLLQEPPKPKTPEEITKIIGANILQFLNKPGTSPPKTPQSLQEYNAWSECCDFCMSLMSGDTMCVSGKMASALAAAKTPPKPLTKTQAKEKRLTDRLQAREDAKKIQAAKPKKGEKK